MSKWKEYRIGEICTLVNGAAFKSNEFQENGVPVIKIANVKPNKILLNDLKCVSNEVAEKQEKSRVRFGDILLTMTGNRKDGGPDSWVGKTALFREWGHYMLNQRLCIVRANEELVNVEYLAYYLSSWNTQLYFINHSTSSGGQANISASIINDYKVILPDINTQMIIASTLNIIDLKIRNNEQINRNLHDQINALYSEKFEKYIMSSNLPAGWQLTKIGNVAEVKNGFAFKGADFVKDGTVPVIKIKNVKPYKILLNTIEYVKEETVIGKDRFKIKHGDILITLTGNRKDGSPDSWVGKIKGFLY